MSEPAARLSRRAALAALLATPLALRDASAAPQDIAGPPDVGPIVKRLTSAPWRADARGPLLIVASERINGEAVRKLQPEPPRGGDRLAELAPLLKRKLTRVGSIWTLVPTTLPTFAPGFYDAPETDFPGLELLANLSAALLEKLAWPGGIGRADLPDAASRAAFERLLPETIAVPRRRLPEGAVSSQLAGVPVASMRLRGYWEVTIIPFFPAGDGSPIASIQAGRTARGVELDRYESKNEPIVNLKLTSPALSAARSPQVDDKGYVAFTPRQSDLSFASSALDRQISLAEVHTVDELIGRIAAASGLNLIADARLGACSVVARGKSARAGDALDTLCRALGGAIRRMPFSESGRPLFLLTQDRVGLYSRIQAAYVKTLRANIETVAPARELAAAFQRQWRRRGVSRLPFFLPDTVTDALRAVLFGPESRVRGRRMVLMSQLPASVAQQVRERWKQMQSTPDGRTTTFPSEPIVTGEISLILEAVLPSLEGSRVVAAIFREDLLGIEPIPPIALPKFVAERTLLTRLPVRDSERDSLIAAAKAAGFTELSVAVGGDPELDRQVAQLARAAKAANLGVVPVLIPFAARPDSPTDARDRDGLGRTMAEAARDPDAVAVARLDHSSAAMLDWLRDVDALEPERVDIDALIRRLGDLAALPGVTELGLEAVRDPDKIESLIGFWHGNVGNDERRRLVIGHQMDPIDLGYGAYGSPAIDAMQYSGSASDLWEARRVQRRREFGARLGRAIDAARIRMPIRLLPGPRIQVSSPGTHSTISERQMWERYVDARSLIPHMTAEKEPASPATAAHPLRAHLTLSDATTLEDLPLHHRRIPDAADIEEEALRRRVAEPFAQWQLPDSQPPDGFVLDLSDRSLADAIEFVKTRLRPPVEWKITP